jgi:hypothetical protein
MNLLVDILSGLLLPGNPVAFMVVKAYSVQTLERATLFLQDLKLGHYIKVPPRAMFLGACWGLCMQSVAVDRFLIVQLIATSLVAFVQVGAKQWIFANVKDMCSATQSDFLTCPNSKELFADSVIWYVVQRGFSYHC